LELPFGEKENEVEKNVVQPFKFEKIENYEIKALVSNLLKIDPLERHDYYQIK